MTVLFPRSDTFTIQLRLYHANKTHYPTDVGHLLNSLMPSKSSYWVPVVVHQDPALHYTDIQYGVKGYPFFTNFWEEYRKKFTAVWGRYYDDRYQEDRMFCDTGDQIWKSTVEGTDYSDDDDIYNYSRPCVYGFDQITIRWKTDVKPPDLGFAVKTELPIWTIPINGHYYAANDRSYTMLDVDPARAVDTPTTSTIDNQGLYFSETPDWPVPSVTQPLDAHRADIEAVELHWQGRRVRLMKPALDKRNPEQWIWRQWYLDHWDNCVDEQWLAFDKQQFPAYIQLT